MEQTIDTSNAHASLIYRTAGTAALLIAATGILDAVTSSLGAGAHDNGAVPITDWFALFQIQPFSAFSALGVFNLITLSLAIPVYLTFVRALRWDHQAPAGLAAVLFFIGTAVYMGSNSVFPLFALSRQYAAASGTQRAVLEAAGTALLAQGADLTAGTFFGLLFAQLAGVLITLVMLRGQVFGRWTALAGLAGFSLMIVFFVLMAFFPAHYDTAMLIAAPGGLVLMAYQILLARRFFQLSKSE
jgi:hypothetical protein